MCWGWYCVTGDMRKDWPRCIPNRSKIEEKTGPAESKHVFQIWLWNGIWNRFEIDFGAIWDTSWWPTRAQDAPKTPQGASKTLPRRFHDPPPKVPPEPPREFQESLFNLCCRGENIVNFQDLVISLVWVRIFVFRFVSGMGSGID